MKIPYAGEQGIFSAEQGIKVPCSAKNRDVPRPMRRLLDAFRTEARAGRKDGGAGDCNDAPRFDCPRLNLQAEKSSTI